MYYHILPMKSNQVGCNKRKEINNEKNINAYYFISNSIYTIIVNMMLYDLAMTPN